MKTPFFQWLLPENIYIYILRTTSEGKQLFHQLGNINTEKQSLGSYCFCCFYFIPTITNSDHIQGFTKFRSVTVSVMAEKITLKIG